MAVNDLRPVGLFDTIPVRIAASATRFEYGEPLVNSQTMTSGAAGTNTYTLAVADFLVADTSGAHFVFGGIAIKRSEPRTTGTLVAQTAIVARPVPDVGRMRGIAETKANIDTESELLDIMLDYVLVDYNATGAPDGGELYTIADTAAANTSLFTIIEGNTTKGTLDVLVSPHAYRQIIS